ncbi:Ser/Thr protein phosphatase family [Aspergillus sclerotioniger CBS 115572]|uniref:Ser/Thr protein phosphatase family n=1 Tax=Aspergillus sclerotioniger CBS 115572 TaxID=1450535 RepID=A0A317XE22_9EURO|nr:Ser/Thr protein phosphatase family [Aspergillus sclerotioniger CBS 115572]PWY96789.1 Ser/Thr protein phosphatase family [Aspergillus sclerotioniger CBS 115572]
MREKAESVGSDLLVIDTGDRVEGNGLYDSSEPKGIYVSEILRQQHIDLISSGNHELYKQSTSEAEFYTTVANFRGNYLASNIDIFHPVLKVFVPLAPRFKKFTTKQQGIRIIAFGFLFDFKKNNNNTVVRPVQKTIKEEWFQDAIRDKEVDLFLVIGHAPVRSDEFHDIYWEIRSIRWDTPIQFFGGHYHIRDYVRFDSKAYGLASGRFMETIGFMSIDGLSTGTHHMQSALAAPRFNRKYIDNNLLSFYHHTGLNEDTFPTEQGTNVSLIIQDSRSALQLDKVLGCAPRDLWMSRVKYPDDDSIYTWLEKEVLPASLGDDSRAGKPALAIVNTGAIRFDIFKGPFTQDTTYIVSPFTSGFRYVKDIPYKKASFVSEVLNKLPGILMQNHQVDFPAEQLAPPEQSAYTHDDVGGNGGRSDTSFLANQASSLNSGYAEPNLIPGYTTKDDGGADGDDTVHSRIPFYHVPNCIQALASSDTPATPDTVDLVYIDFIESDVAMAATFAGLTVDFTHDSDVYMPSTTLTTLISDWIKDNWACDEA